MPKQRRTVPTRHIHLHIDEDLINKIDLLLLDPVTGKPVYGARTKLIEDLFSGFLQAYTAQSTSMDLSTILAQFRTWMQRS